MNSIHYEEHGEGPVLILIHGFCESQEIWNNLTPDLSSAFRVITIDLPGFGETPILKPTFTLKAVASEVLELLKSLNIQKCVVIGHSLGGYIALAIAEQRPDLIKGLCLFHSTASSDSEEKKLNRDKVIAFIEKNGVHPFIETFVPGLFYNKSQLNLEIVHKIASKTSKNTIISYSRAMRDRPNMISFLASFSNKILFIAGENDTIISKSALEEQAKLIPNGKLIILAETGHMGMYEDVMHSLRALKDFSESCFLNDNH
jgi:pimeloyl-ACP methyl ester carboxylesterase